MQTNNKQTASSILMIEPVAFGFNDQTAVNNYFQQKDNESSSTIQEMALAEFNGMVHKLRSKGINVIVVKDTPDPHTPDSIFPNNWISFHSNGQVVFYPMYAPNRRAERRLDIIDLIKKSGFEITEIKDFTSYEKDNRFLEGTGGMIFDHANKIAYAAISQRTEKDLFILFCNKLNYSPVYFTANQTVNNQRLPIYHTNVMMCIADRYVVICIDTIDNPEERNNLLDVFRKTGKEVIEITEDQMHHFAGNMLQVGNQAGTQYLVMSQTAFNSLTDQQKERITHYNEIITASIPTIEKYGGGSARCMMAEIFNKHI